MPVHAPVHAERSAAARVVTLRKSLPELERWSPELSRGAVDMRWTVPCPERSRRVVWRPGGGSVPFAIPESPDEKHLDGG